eukprot:GHVT01050092.1.p1 GENE.GHVT01050092.1~~GHVT01050092.1.p1  ORF type:complete len:132 (+),score=34.26 GHVT01050092.1:243-638(+)
MLGRARPWPFAPLCFYRRPSPCTPSPQTRQQLSASDRRSCSVQLLFVCLLYACNDQGFRLVRDQSSSSFWVAPVSGDGAARGGGGAELEQAAGREGTAGAAPADGDDVHDELNLADVSLFKLPDVLMKPLA